MKRIVIYMLFVISMIDIKAQEIYQQTAMELNKVLDNDKSYLCQATATIELQPGFV